VDRLLDDGFVQMVTMSDARLAVHVVGRSGKYPLPAPLAAGIGVLAGQRVRQWHLSQPDLQIGFVLLAHVPQVILEGLEECPRQHGDPILLTFALPAADFPTTEVQVFDA
jgi:hypothetical protein